MILQACPTCDRQYDITTVPVGRRIRCACDSVMTVRIPSEITVRARKCGNCGGRIELGEKACGYCSSKLVQLDLEATLCPKCFKRVEGDAQHCQGCGTRISPQALTALEDGVVCPRCEGQLRARSLGEACVVECTGCEGIWVAADTFDGLCVAAHRDPAGMLGGVPLGAPAENLAIEPVRYIPCLSCKQLMLRRNFRYGNKSSRVIIDFCQDHGVWLDHKELERVMSFIRERASASMGDRFPSDDRLQGGHQGVMNAPRKPATDGLPSIPVGRSGGVGGLGNFSLGETLWWLLGDLF